MKPGSHNPRYSDTIAQHRQRREKALRFFVFILTVAVVGGTGYWVFWSDALRIHSVQVSGLGRVHEDEIMSRVNEALSASLLSVIPTGNNMLLFDSDSVQARIANDFPEVKSVSIARDFPHTVLINIAEREPIGTWCFKGVCRHFDIEGRTWGDVSRSSGSLLLIIDDYKHDSADLIGPSLLTPIRTAAEGLSKQGIAIQYLVIPDNQFNDLWAVTNRGYTIYFNFDDSIEDQLATLNIFLDRMNGDTFHPQYLDLRIADRVYYK